MSAQSLLFRRVLKPVNLVLYFRWTMPKLGFKMCFHRYIQTTASRLFGYTPFPSQYYLKKRKSLQILKEIYLSHFSSCLHVNSICKTRCTQSNAMMLIVT